MATTQNELQEALSVNDRLQMEIERLKKDVRIPSLIATFAFWY